MTMVIDYYMHVDWGWSRQRPHFLAEELSKTFDVLVLYKSSMRRGSLAPNPSPVSRSPIRTSAFSERLSSPTMARIVALELKAKTRKRHTDLAWLTWPNQIEYVGRGSVVYDCMDLAQHFPGSEKWKARVSRNERDLVNRSDLIIASSDRIAEHIVDLRTDAPVVVVPNGHDWSLRGWDSERAAPTAALHLGYFGTIAPWFDFTGLLRVLDELPLSRATLIGPTAGVDVPTHERLTWLGAQPHSRLAELCAEVDVFIMPFRVNDLIRGVDPVKLYEYLASGRPVLAPRYPAVERFEPHVSLYDDHDDLIRRLHSLIAIGVPRRDHVAINAFLSESTWSNRASAVARHLISLR